MNIRNIPGILILTIGLISCQQPANDLWIVDCDPNDETSCGFKNGEGELQIEYGKYPMIFTDTFRNYAIVVDNKDGIIGIDKAEQLLYKVFVYDNGPDYIADGYFRIVKDGKIGFADAQTGEIVISPQYAAARPFQNGYAAICPDCESRKEGEYSSWVNGKWGIMDKQGKVVLAPTFDNITSIDANGQASVIEDSVTKVIDLAEKR